MKVVVFISLSPLAPLPRPQQQTPATDAEGRDHHGERAKNGTELHTGQS
eukprot:CAMPEP_0204012732 /NCGR_PEP_ID=MMETSP0360-20130528/24211_1 /ASSEMBLY_ACC=CAM_ASM_000342 /TAXON_ID=268821 /ORGANISM="Scrippsiella Hangoei, Strain SHTV-5" /LENGTH=48 /DNA_ID= /DNA_START= /DNA_END= /DNA_ORIENTATION=